MSVRQKLTKLFPPLLLLVCTVVFIYFLKQNTATLFNRVSHDPLFYIPLVDTKALAEAVLSLDEEQKRIQKSIAARIAEGTAASDEKTAALLLEISDAGFIPIAYLESLPRTITATDRFLNKPSIINAFRLNVAVLKAASAYQKTSARQRAMAELAHAADPFTIGMISARTSTKVLAADFALVEKNGEELNREAKVRFWCLFALKCSLSATPSNHSSAAPPAFTIEEYEFLPDEIAGLDFPNFKRYGPYLVENDCLQQQYIPYYIYTDFTSSFNAKDATNNYYYDVSTAPSEPDTFVGTLGSLGIHYDAQPEGATYRCINLKYWGDLSALYYFSEVRGMGEIISSYDLDVLRRELKISKADSSLADIRILDNRLMHLPAMLATMERYLEVLEAQLQAYKTPLKPMYFIGVRSNYTLTYQTFMRSAWRLDETPQYEDEKNLPVEAGYTTYMMLRDEFDIDEIKRFHEKREY